MPQIDNIPDFDNQFVGIDTFHPPFALGKGFATQMDELYIDGGQLRTRSGKQGILTTAHAFPIYCPVPWLNADGSVDVYYSGGGNLYKAPKAGGSATQITLATSLVSANVYMAKGNGYIFLVDASGNLVRVNPNTATATTALALSQPPYTLSVQPTNFTLDAFTSTSGWTSSPYVTNTSNLLQNQSFEGGLYQGGDAQGTSGYARYWTVPNGSDPDIKQNGDPASGNYAQTGFGTWCMQLDGNDEIKQYNTAPVLSDASGHGRLYTFSMYGHNAGGADMVAQVTVTATNGGNTSSVVQILSFGANDTVKTHFIQQSMTADFSTWIYDPLTITVDVLQLSPSNAYTSLYIDNLSLSAISSQLTLSQLTTNSFSVGASTTYTKGAYLKQDYGTGGKDFTPPTIGIQFALRGLTNTPPIKVQMQGAASTGDSTLYDVPVKFAADNSYFNLDTSRIPAATLVAIRYFYITFTDNLPTLSQDAKLNLTSLFSIGPIVNAGNLSSPLYVPSVTPYTWYVTEINNAGDSTLKNIIESDPANPTPPMTPTGILAAANITLPGTAPTNTGGNAATHYGFYRVGGTYTDGLARLVAYVPIGSDVAYGADSLDNPVNPYFKWNHTAKTFLDNTPDSFLEFGYIFMLTGRTPAPVGAQRVTFWQNRVWVSKGSDLYASWQVNTGSSASLYFPTVVLPDDPNASVKGDYFSATPTDNDSISALVPTESQLNILKSRHVSVVSGTDPAYWRLDNYLYAAGVGNLAPRAAGIVGNHLWFVGASGLYEFDGNIVTPVSVAIEKSLNPSETGGTAISSTAYAGIVMCYHGRRLHLFAPVQGGSVNSVDYVYDSRQNGWARWLLGNITGAASLASGADTDELFLTGYDGQVYKMVGSVDKATPSASAVPISFSFTSRAYGLEALGGSYIREKKATRFSALVQSNETVSLSLSVLSANGNTYPIPTQSIASGQIRPLWLSCRNDTRGRWLQVQISGSTSTPFLITEVGLLFAAGKVKA